MTEDWKTLSEHVEDTEQALGLPDPVAVTLDYRRRMEIMEAARAQVAAAQQLTQDDFGLAD